jgi:hypothetical protein
MTLQPPCELPEVDVNVGLVINPLLRATRRDPRQVASAKVVCDGPGE